MIDLLKDEKKFRLLFFGMLALDILVKLYLPAYPYRYISKPPLLLLLYFYYQVNNKEKSKKKYFWINLALITFFLGDILVINYHNTMFLIASLICFSLGKIFLCIRFSHKTDFEIS